MKPPRLIAPSTQALVREGRKTKGYRLFDFLHGYVYARWPYLYIGIGTGEHRLAKIYLRLAKTWESTLGKWRKSNGKRQTNSASSPLPLANSHLPSATSHLPSDHPHMKFEDTYHGKVVPLEAAKQLVLVNEPVRLENLEKIIPYARARDIILQDPDHIIALECPCRAGRPNPCLPLDVCLIVGEPFAGFVAEHHPRRSRWITQQQAVEILRQEDERGHVHHAFFKDAMLGRFYAICNCCDCCCGAMQAQRHGTLMLTSSGYVCRMDENRCIGCGECNPYCQFKALSVQGAYTHVDETKCLGCGVCVSKCAYGALELVREPGKGEPLEIQKLIETASRSQDTMVGL
jgi:Pyruvate/2-oxoacid:ferredoxin oxidoreductase delta subunit